LRTLAARIIVAASLASAVILVQTPLLADLLHVSSLHLDDWAIATAGGLVPCIIASLLNGRPGRTRST
jgi:Ca2+-transporting ATPase